MAIDSNGVPIFPYNIGRGYYGDPTGGAVTSITETVATNFVGGASSTLKLGAPGWSNNTVTLAWSAVEGGTYQVQSTTNLSTWTTNATNIGAVQRSGSYSGASAGNNRFFRVVLTNLASYDSATPSGGILSVSPTSASRGATIGLTINLDPADNPPPQTAPIISVTIGSIAGTSNTHVSQLEVTNIVSIPTNAATGPQTVSVVFPGPPDDPTDYVTNTLVNGFTIN